MAHLITFSTEQFDVSRETPNDINPIAGQGLLHWIGEKLTGTGYTATEPGPEDWGWYMDVQGHGASYLVGASGAPEPDRADVDWTIQLHRSRTLMDKLAGRNKLAPDDALFALIERWVRAEPSFRGVSVERGE